MDALNEPGNLEKKGGGKKCEFVFEEYVIKCMYIHGDQVKVAQTSLAFPDFAVLDIFY